MIKKTLLKILGFFFLIVGAIGIFMPVLPTTPFVLLAAICFSTASPKVYEKLLKNRFFGAYIENFRTKKGIPLKQKIFSISSLWILLILSMILINKPIMYIILMIVGIGVTIHLLMIKTKVEADTIKEPILVEKEKVVMKTKGNEEGF